MNTHALSTNELKWPTFIFAKIYNGNNNSILLYFCFEKKYFVESSFNYDGDSRVVTYHYEGRKKQSILQRGSFQVTSFTSLSFSLTHSFSFFLSLSLSLTHSFFLSLCISICNFSFSLSHTLFFFLILLLSLSLFCLSRLSIDLFKFKLIIN